MRLKLLGAALLLIGSVQSSFGVQITNGTFTIVGNVYVTDTSGLAVLPAGLSCPAGTACILWQDNSGLPAGDNFADISGGGLPNGDIPLALAMPSVDAANMFTLKNPTEIVGAPGFLDTLFMSFNTDSITTKLFVNFIQPGIYTPAGCGAGGTQCTPPGSLFSFANNPNSTSSATWVLSGDTGASNVGSESLFKAIFTSQFSVPYQTVLANLAANHFATDTYSASVTLSTIPEPESLLMIGTGLMGLAALLRRRRAK